MDIYDLDLNAELVVLSACNTALGKQVSGEGLVGLSRAFLAAGSRRILATLWAVPDQATAILMEAFYKQLFQQGSAPAVALRKAQLRLRSNPRYRDPYYWGAFVLQGAW